MVYADTINCSTVVESRGEGGGGGGTLIGRHSGGGGGGGGGGVLIGPHGGGGGGEHNCKYRAEALILQQRLLEAKNSVDYLRLENEVVKAQLRTYKEKEEKLHLNRLVMELLQKKRKLISDEPTLSEQGQPLPKQMIMNKFGNDFSKDSHASENRNEINCEPKMSFDTTIEKDEVDITTTFNDVFMEVPRKAAKLTGSPSERIQPSKELADGRENRNKVISLRQVAEGHDRSGNNIAMGRAESGGTLQQTTVSEISCAQCAKKFSQTRFLLSHMLLHSNDRRNQTCVVCGKTFADEQIFRTCSTQACIDKEEEESKDNETIKENDVKNEPSLNKTGLDYTNDDTVRSTQVECEDELHPTSADKTQPDGSGTNVAAAGEKSVAAAGEKSVAAAGEKSVAAAEKAVNFSCVDCGAEFASELYLRSHASLHSNDLQHQTCVVCGSVFGDSAVFRTCSSPTCVDKEENDEMTTTSNDDDAEK